MPDSSSEATTGICGLAAVATASILADRSARVPHPAFTAN